MYSYLYRFGAAAMVALVLWAVQPSPASAQAVPRVYPNTRMMVDPNPYIGNGMTLRQYTYNMRQLNRAYATTPPWMYGYNPYITSAYYGPVVPMQTPYFYYNNPYYSAYNPYALYGLYGLSP